MGKMEKGCSDCQNGRRERSWQDDESVKQLTVRLNRIEGQVRGIKRMIAEGIYCDDVLNQIASIRSAMDGVSKLLLEKHMKSCVREQLLEGDAQVIDELLKTISKIIR